MAKVTLNKSDGTYIADIDVPLDGSWMIIPPEVAMQSVNLEGEWTTEMLWDGTLVVMIRLQNNEAQFHVDTAFNTVKMLTAPPEPVAAAGFGTLTVDSYVIRADGSIEH